MSYIVVLTKDAEADLEDIYDYIAAHDSTMSSDHVLDELLKATESLTTFPEKGSYPAELKELGIQEYRQTFFKPYRIIYQITKNQVTIFVIADGRRDMQTLLARRLLAS